MENEKEVAKVPFYVYEAAEARADRRATRLKILCGVMAAAFVINNAIWILVFLNR